MTSMPVPTNGPVAQPKDAPEGAAAPPAVATGEAPPAVASRHRARLVIERLGASGTPPEWGCHLYSAGLDPYLRVLEDEYLASFIPDGGSAFKLVVGAYGGGKTHFLYCVRERALRRSLAVAYVPLSPEETPFADRLKVYRAILSAVTTPFLTPDEALSGTGRGLGAFLRREVERRRDERTARGEPADEALTHAADDVARASDGAPLGAFARAVRGATAALDRGEDPRFEAFCSYLAGERHEQARSYDLPAPLDAGNAFMALRSLVHWLAGLGHRGLVLLFDEAELVPSLSTKQRNLLLSNLREIIDECGMARFRSVLILYAVPDESVFSGRGAVYQALQQRLATIFDLKNPLGVKVRLDRIGPADPIPLLVEIGRKIADIFAVAFEATLDAARARKLIEAVAAEAFERRFAEVGYRRLFVQALVHGLQQLRADPAVVDSAGFATRILDEIGG